MTDSTRQPGAFSWPALLWKILIPAAGLAWLVGLCVLIGRVIAKPERATNTSRYLRAGLRWIAGDNLYSYTPNKGFVYGPFSAVCYAATTWLPNVLAHIFWILFSSALLLGGLWLILSKGPFAHISARGRALVFLLVFPLSLGNLDAAQANPVVIGCVMIAVAAACMERWTIAALALALAVHWKVYPLVVGFLLILVAPGKFTWRLVLAVALMGFAPYLFQKAAYVTDQYQLWYATRTADNRLVYELGIAPRDLWFLLVRVMHLPLSPRAYQAIQALSGAAIAVYCLYGRYKGWSRQRLLGGLFTFVCLWMILCGPASEMHAYLLIAPAAAFAVAESFFGRMPAGLRVLAALSYFCLLFALLRVAFLHKFEPGWILAIQPVGALILLAYALWRYLDDRVQPGDSPPS